MSGKKMTYLIAAVVVVGIAYFVWKMTSRSGYESAEYTLIEADGAFELRDYPDLMLVTTSMKFQQQGNDGSFGRLFRYISGANADGRNNETRTKANASLREWLASKGLEGQDGEEFAGYDPPWTPGPLRRNEILVRLDINRSDDP